MVRFFISICACFLSLLLSAHAQDKKPAPLGKECGEVVAVRSERHVAIRKSNGNYIYVRVAWLKALSSDGDRFDARLMIDRAVYGKEACVVLWHVYGRKIVDSARGKQALYVYGEVNVKGLGDLTSWILKNGYGQLDTKTLSKVLGQRKLAEYKSLEDVARRKKAGIWSEQ